jgi:hypothetical protein
MLKKPSFATARCKHGVLIVVMWLRRIEDVQRREMLLIEHPRFAKGHVEGKL